MTGFLKPDTYDRVLACAESHACNRVPYLTDMTGFLKPDTYDRVPYLMDMTGLCNLSPKTFGSCITVGFSNTPAHAKDLRLQEPVGHMSTLFGVIHMG